MSHNRAIAYIRQLCCLGLGAEITMAELVSTIKSAIPSEGNVFLVVGRDGIPIHLIPEFVVPEAIGIFQEKGTDLYPRPEETHARVMGWYDVHRIMDDPRVIEPAFFATDFYHLVWRPYGHYHSMQALLRVRGVPAGTFLVFRPRSSPAFSQHEKALYESLLPYMEHALQGGCAAETDFFGDGETGLFVMDSEGSLIYASDTANKLLALARNPYYAVRGKNGLVQGPVPPTVGQLCRNLAEIFRGREAPPPKFTHINARGRFEFRAHWLDALSRDSGGLIGVTLEHHEPGMLRVLRRLKDWRLSPTQMEVCLLLAKGYTNEMIGRQLHVKNTTVKDHVRKIFDKLGINRRDELVGRLSGKPSLEPLRLP